MRFSRCANSSSFAADTLPPRVREARSGSAVKVVRGHSPSCLVVTKSVDAAAIVRPIRRSSSAAFAIDL